MTDNRTTELESLSKLKMAGKLRFWRGAIEIPESELHAICDEIQTEHDRAVAATLGEQRSTVEIAELLDEFEHECYMLRVEASETRARDDVVREAYERIRDEFAGRIAATVGSEYHGYEQAAIEAWESIKAWNTRATVGNETCELRNDVCSECGAIVEHVTHSVYEMGDSFACHPKFCPSCGAQIRKAVKR